jgi:hypothetical protein
MLSTQQLESTNCSLLTHTNSYDGGAHWRCLPPPPAVAMALPLHALPLTYVMRAVLCCAVLGHTQAQVWGLCAYPSGCHHGPALAHSPLIHVMRAVLCCAVLGGMQAPCHLVPTTCPCPCPHSSPVLSPQAHASQQGPPGWQAYSRVTISSSSTRQGQQQQHQQQQWRASFRSYHRPSSHGGGSRCSSTGFQRHQQQKEECASVLRSTREFASFVFEMVHSRWCSFLAVLSCSLQWCRC